MVGKMRVPVVPILLIKEVFNAFGARERDGWSRMFCGPVGMRREEQNDIAVNALGEERRGLGVKGRNKMPLGKIEGCIADGERDPDIIGAEGVAAERSVETVPAVFKEGHARVLTAEHVPRFLRDNNLLS